MEYITFIEHNRKERESFIFFLQYTGNEEMLTKLHTFVESADSSYMDGDYSKFEMNIQNKLSESAVNEMITVQYGSYSRMFQKVNGKFSYWFPDEMEDEDETIIKIKMDPEEKANKLDGCFFGCLIKGYFKM